MLQPGSSSRRRDFCFLDLLRVLRVPPELGDAALSPAPAERSQNLPPIPAGSLRKAQSWLGELKGFYVARGLQKYHFQSDPASTHASWLMASISQNTKGGSGKSLGSPGRCFGNTALHSHSPTNTQTTSLAPVGPPAPALMPGFILLPVIPAALGGFFD